MGKRSRKGGGERDPSHDRGGLTRIGSLFGELPKPIRPVVNPGSNIGVRLIETAASNDPQSIVYQHTVFCQTGLPYRDPGDDVRVIERVNGNVGLQITAGSAWHRRQGAFVQVGIPFGTKPRLILADINTQAILTQSPQIDLEQTITRFVKRMSLDPKGRNIRMVKDAMTRLCAASIRIGITSGDHGLTVQGQLMNSFDIWFPKDERQRVLWPSTAQISGDYFNSLLAHAVPLDEAHYLALSHSALALDIYAWLAQRLHRVKPGPGILIAWPLLHQQFGWNYARLRKFREVFMVALREVLTVYKAALVHSDERGLVLLNSAPPVLKNSVMISR